MRIRLAFVISQLIQGGSERSVYELATRLDRARFDVAVITRRDARAHFYAPLIEAAGIRVAYVYPDGAVPTTGDIDLFRQALSDFDLVVAAQIENYARLQAAFDHRRLIIHLMSDAIQYFPNYPYSCLYSSISYNLTYYRKQQIEEIRHPRKAEFNTFELPQAMDLTPYRDCQLYRPPGEAEPVRLAIAQRLSAERPIEPLLVAFHCVRRSFPAAHLHIYGGGDAGLWQRLLSLLKIDGRVTFEGHQEDFEDRLLRDRITLVLATCNDGAVGYGPLQVAARGIPIAFWELGRADTPSLSACDNIPDFVDQICGWLRDPGALAARGALLRRHVFERHDISACLKPLEAWLADIAARKDDAPPLWPSGGPLRGVAREEIASFEGPFLIYGTGRAGLTLFEELESLGRLPSAFVRGSDAGELRGLPIIPLPKLKEHFPADVLIVIASQFATTIMGDLVLHGYTNFCRLAESAA